MDPCSVSKIFRFLEGYKTVQNLLKSLKPAKEVQLHAAPGGDLWHYRAPHLSPWVSFFRELLGCIKWGHYTGGWVFCQRYTQTICSGHLCSTNTTSILEAQPSSHTSSGPELQGPSKLLYSNPTVASLPPPAHILPSSPSQRSHVDDWDRREEGPGPGQEAKGTNLAAALRAVGL